MNSNRQLAKQLRTELETALAPIANKYNLNFEIGSCGYSDTEAVFRKIIFSTKSNTASPVSSAFDPASIGTKFNTPMAQMYISHSASFGLPTDGLGKQFRYAGRTFTIVGLKPSNRKYPVISEGSQGGRYKFSADIASNIIG